MKLRHFLFFAICLFSSVRAIAQDSSSLTFSGYCELYYGFDFDRPVSHERPFFLYNYKRHNETGINLAYAKAGYSAVNVRSGLALMAGNYPQYTLAAEPELLRLIYEANIGIRISRKHNVWLDAGILPSHIGTESATGADCWTVSRSIVAENTPYYETGVKVTVTNRIGNLFLSALVLNGWQHIQMPAGINTPSFGLQVHYQQNDRLTLNYSNFIGTDRPDSVHAVRTYHNLYLIYQFSKRWGWMGGLDIGEDKNRDNQYAWWYAPIILVRCGLNTYSFLTFRGEYFRDAGQAILITNTAHGFQTWGLSLNYDYLVAKQVMVRAEGKGYFAKDKIFKDGQENNNYSVLVSMSIRL